MFSPEMKWPTKPEAGSHKPTIYGKHGEICEYGQDEIDVWVTSLRVANRLEKRWPAVQHYDDGACFIRPISDVDTACRWIKAKKRRQVPQKERQRRAARMRSLKNFPSNSTLPAPNIPEEA